MTSDGHAADGEHNLQTDVVIPFPAFTNVEPQAANQSQSCSCRSRCPGLNCGLLSIHTDHTEFPLQAVKFIVSSFKSSRNRILAEKQHKVVTQTEPSREL